MLRTRSRKSMGDRAEIELSGIHVLVIDDDRLTRHFLGSVLESSGAIVTAAAASAAIRAALIADVIVCDLVSVETAGREFLSLIRALARSETARSNERIAVRRLTPHNIALISAIA